MQYNNRILCEEFVSELWKFLDRSLPEEEFIFWENHLKACSLCRARLAETERTLSVYESLPLSDISDDTFDRMIVKATKRKRVFAWLSKLKLPEMKLSAPLSLVFNRIALSTASVAVILTLFFIFHKPEIEKPGSRQLTSIDSASGNSSLSASPAEQDVNSVSEIKSNPEVSYMQVRYEWKGEKLNKKIVEVGTNLVRMEATSQGSNVYKDKWAIRAYLIARQIERLKKEIDDSSL